MAEKRVKVFHHRSLFDLPTELLVEVLLWLGLGNIQRHKVYLVCRRLYNLILETDLLFDGWELPALKIPREYILCTGYKTSLVPLLLDPFERSHAWYVWNAIRGISPVYHDWDVEQHRLYFNGPKFECTILLTFLETYDPGPRIIDGITIYNREFARIEIPFSITARLNRPWIDGRDFVRGMEQFSIAEYARRYGKCWTTSWMSVRFFTGSNICNLMCVIQFWSDDLWFKVPQLADYVWQERKNLNNLSRHRVDT